MPKIISDTHPIRLHYLRGRSHISALLHNFPGKKMHIIGVTGTDGKTTTTHYISHILEQCHISVGHLSTVSIKNRLGEEKNTTHMTMPSRRLLNQILAKAHSSGCTHFVMEFSSQGLLQGRQAGMHIDTAVFTNLTPEHLDYHRTITHYRQSKEILFYQTAQQKGSNSIINLADPSATFFEQYPTSNKYFFLADQDTATTIKDATFKTTIVQLTKSQLIIHQPAANSQTRTTTIDISLPFTEYFNIQNAAAAVSVALALDCQPADIATALRSLPTVPGRCEKITIASGATAVLDFALTPNALRNILTEQRRLTTGKLYIVFGCTGDRDHSKRQPMGQIASHLADHVYLTDDEPYSEDPQKIADQIISGMTRSNYNYIADRKHAIQYALSTAKQGDTVIISGMGDFSSRVIAKNQKIPWSDREIILEAVGSAK